MVRQVVLLSGSVSAGKSTLCQLLEARFGFTHVKTLDFLKERKDARLERKALQDLGEELDRRTKGAWVREGLDRSMRNLDENERICVDAVRIPEQINEIRRAYGSDKVVHIHLTAPREVLGRRYARRRGKRIKELPSYDEVLKNKTESQVEKLKTVADVVIDTHRCTEDDVLTRAASHLGLYGRGYARLVDVLVGGQYGSEGKGHIASYLSREYDLLVRVGGPNAGHTVFDEPEPAKYHHLPSGTRHSVAKLLIGPGAVVRVQTLLEEIAESQVSADRLSIDPQVVIIEDKDRDREKGLVETIASTGQGVGAATARRILERGQKSVRLARDVPDLKPFLRYACELLDDEFREGHKVLLEGTQGTGLSLYHGCYPYVTSRDTTVAGCLAEAGISPSRVRRVVMVCRSYPIRVQDPEGDGRTSGPMSQPISWKEVARRSGIAYERLRSAEKTTTTRRRRRVAEFDWQLLRKAASLNGPTDVALTFSDYISSKNTEARRFEQLTEDTIRFIQEIERVAGAPVSLISTRFHWRSIIDRRVW